MSRDTSNYRLWRESACSRRNITQLGGTYMSSASIASRSCAKGSFEDRSNDMPTANLTPESVRDRVRSLSEDAAQKGTRIYTVQRKVANRITDVKPEVYQHE